MAVHVGSARQRFGRVSVYLHHGAYYVYYRRGARIWRQRVGISAATAECRACLLNASLLAEEAGLEIAPEVERVFGTGRSPTLATSTSPAEVSHTTITQLRAAFLRHHEVVLGSALRTVSRYSAATAYVERYAHEVCVTDPMAIITADFTAALRVMEIAPNGHSHTCKRRLRDSGIRYILDTTRSMYRFGIAQELLPKDRPSPFSATGLPRIKLRDTKAIFVFSPDQELKFFQAADFWHFAIHFTLAKTGLRPGELAHLLIEELDLTAGWLSVTNKSDLGWTIKTGRERRVPLIPELMELLRQVVGPRTYGPVFLRQRTNDHPKLIGDHAALTRTAQLRLEAARAGGTKLSRALEGKVHAGIWRDAGAVTENRIRMSFITTCKRAGLNTTCVKSWRHTFATLLQEANVDLLVRQITLGHKSTDPSSSPMGMTIVYTHTRPEFQHREIARAMALRPYTLELVGNLLTKPNERAVHVRN